MLLLAGCGRGDEVVTTASPPTQVRHDLGPLTYWLDLAIPTWTRKATTWC